MNNSQNKLNTDWFYGNPEPRRLNSSNVVSRKVQRLSVEDEDTNKTLKIGTWADSNPNDPLPYCVVEEEIVRHPLKSGVCFSRTHVKKQLRQLPVIAALLPSKMAA
jgi:hypothetical protein